MASFIWDRSPQESFANPYEYEAQDQFLRESKGFLDSLHAHPCGSTHRFQRDDTSREKAVWMLQIDALDALRDCLGLLKDKRHQVAGRLLRGIAEALDLAAYFACANEESSKHLANWYRDEIIPHRVYRDFIKSSVSVELAEGAKKEYESLSRIAHRSYRTLAYGYVLAAGERLAYEGVAPILLTPPHTISLYIAFVADLTKRFKSEVVIRNTLALAIVDAAWEQALEDVSISPRFVPHPPFTSKSV